MGGCADAAWEGVVASASSCPGFVYTSQAAVNRLQEACVRRSLCGVTPSPTPPFPQNFRSSCKHRCARFHPQRVVDMRCPVVSSQHRTPAPACTARCTAAAFLSLHPRCWHRHRKHYRQLDECHKKCSSQAGDNIQVCSDGVGHNLGYARHASI